MDFAEHYTEEQERFRREVGAWLDAHVPPEIQGVPASRAMAPETWELAKSFCHQLGKQGWLAPADPVEWGGGDLSPDHEVVVLEELDKRELQWALERTTPALRMTLHGWGSDEQKQEYLSALSQGQLTIWRLAMEPREEVDPRDLHIEAFRDGDDYVLNGQNLFLGQGPWPDYLWTLAVTDPDAPPRQSTAAFLVPGNLEGISVQALKTLVQGETHRVVFENVRVPPYSLLGDETEGWLMMRATTLAAPVSEPSPTYEQEVADLLQWAREAKRDGVVISKEPFFQQLLIEAYTNSEIARLFRLRNHWMRTTGQELTYHEAQATLWAKRSALRLSQIVRDVMGVYALLDEQDSRAPHQGEFELLQRESLSLQNPGGSLEVQAEAMARGLELGKPTPREEPEDQEEPAASTSEPIETSHAH